MKERWLAFVDLEKAFDRVQFVVLWLAFRDANLEEWFVNVIKLLYAGAIAVVKKMNGETHFSTEMSRTGPPDYISLVTFPSVYIVYITFSSISFILLVNF